MARLATVIHVQSIGQWADSRHMSATPVSSMNWDWEVSTHQKYILISNLYLFRYYYYPCRYFIITIKLFGSSPLLQISSPTQSRRVHQIKIRGFRITTLKWLLWKKTQPVIFRRLLWFANYCLMPPVRPKVSDSNSTNPRCWKTPRWGISQVLCCPSVCEISSK